MKYLILFFLGVLMTNPAIAQQESLQHISESDLNLLKKFDINVRSASIKDILNAITMKYDIQFSVEEDLGHRRCSFFAKDITVFSFLNTLEKVHNVTCRKSFENNRVAYELYQTDEQKKTEAKQISDSLRRESQFRMLQRQNIINSVQNAIDKNDSNFQGLTDFIKTLSKQQIDTAADSAIEPPDIISASDQSHFHKHFFFSKKLASLDKNTQKSIRSLLQNEFYDQNNINYDKLQVGLVGAAGGFRLGVVEPAGTDIWVSPNIYLGNALEMDSKRSVNDFNPEVRRIRQSKTLIDISLMPPTQRASKIVIDSKIDYRYLSQIMEMISGQANVKIACDDYLNSRYVTRKMALSKKEYTLEELLFLIASEFRHKIIFSDGVLQVKTLVLGLDLRSEPHFKVMNRLNELSDDNRQILVSDYFLLGSCTVLQVRCIMRNHVIMSFKNYLIIKSLRDYEVLQLISSFDDGQKLESYSENGIGIQKLNNNQRKLFYKILSLGLKSSKLDKKLMPLHIYIQEKNYLEGKNRVPRLSVILAGQGNPMALHKYSF